ncbi:hypothetical protein M422DRAFT_61387 [Sphaerobolus stellatus SS14]|uniref:Uncharacterized protein n=1 Tax=Sphaerobolus stellatus (strain SS14) TaxID=990650 RepID=A0A0C9UZE0_SPHS4|nr:hypothetical protein M422DRAFT_61387 [Sphaerobolus stellatus SS14]
MVVKSAPHPLQMLPTEVFDRPSKPRAYYARPQRKQELPEVKSRFTLVALLTVAGLSAWGAFILYATNMERASSSVVRQLATNLKNMEALKEVLGDNVHLEGKWWLADEPWINGAINLLQGNVDVSFRVRGSNGGGTVYFTSVREEKGRPFTILRYKLICDNGEILRLNDIKL